MVILDRSNRKLIQPVFQERGKTKEEKCITKKPSMALEVLTTFGHSADRGSPSIVPPYTHARTHAHTQRVRSLLSLRMHFDSEEYVRY